jgi:hypothetical protein
MRIQPSPAAGVQNTQAPTTHLPATSTPFSSLIAKKSATTPASQTSSTSGAPPANSVDSGADTGEVQSSLDQSQDENLQFLQLQSQMNTQSETFTTLSNVMKTENDTIKNTAGNMQI